jgi:hypothetical protein
VQLTKTYQNGKNENDQMTTYVGRVPITHKICQIALKYTNNMHSKALKNVPKIGFLVGKYNRPSGNPE